MKCEHCGYDEGAPCKFPDQGRQGCAREAQLSQTEEQKAKAEIARITNAIIDEIGTLEVQAGLTVICNMAGQLVWALCEGKPAMINEHVAVFAANLNKIATATMFREDAQRRAAIQTENEQKH
jgi:hypothetical protein